MKVFAGFQKNHCLQPMLRPYRWRIWLLGAMAVVQSVLQVGMALIFRYVIDAVLSHTDEALLWSILLVADLILQVGLYEVKTWLTASTADHLTAALRLQLLDSTLNSAASRLEKFHSGQMLSRGMEDVRALCDSLVSATPELVGQVTRLAAAFAAILLIYPTVALVLLVIGAMVLAGVAVLRPVLKKKHQAVRAADELVMSAMQEDMQQLELIQSLDVQKQILKRFNKQQNESLHARFHQRCWSVGSNAVVNTLSMTGTGVLLLWGAAKVADGLLSYGSLTSLIQLLNQFRGPVLGLSGIWSRFVSMEVSAERLTELLKTDQAELTPRQVENPRAVVFEDVTFSYDGEETAVLENFSLRLPLDDWTCLSGISGRGKSTLFKLILGLHTPKKGRVYLETDQGPISCGANTRHLFAYVPQDYALFSGTILENLLLVAPDVDDKRRRTALELAQAEFVWDMSSEENTALRENNAGLSKGQIQRLAIARALLMERPVLLLDECTSALDADTENAVLHNLRRTGKRAIVVTHRPEVLDDLQGITPVSMEM